MRRQHDVVALVCGVCFAGLAVVALVDTFVGAVSWTVLKVVAPLVLVAVGVVGLALSRHRPSSASHHNPEDQEGPA